MRSLHMRWPWLLLGCALLLTGCEEDPIFHTKYRPPPIRIKPKERLTVKKPTITFIYSPINKRDPFRPTWLTKTVRTPQAKAAKATVAVKLVRRPKTALEKFELDQLKVVAIVTGVANPVSMVEDPTGQGFMVRRGTLIGRNGGRVTRIYASGLVISEVYRDVTGKRIVNRVTLRLQKSGKKTASGSMTIGGRKLYIRGGRIRYGSTIQNTTNRTNKLFRRRGVGAQ